MARDYKKLAELNYYIRFTKECGYYEELWAKANQRYLKISPHPTLPGGERERVRGRKC
jgi:hypothetical protein